MPKLYSARVAISAFGRAGFSIGTFSSILSQAEMTREEFEKFVK